MKDTSKPGGEPSASSEPTLDVGTRRSAVRWPVLEALAVFVLGMAVMRFVYAGPNLTIPADTGLPGHDSFYHLKMAVLIPQYGLLHQFPWLEFVYFTEKGQGFVSHHCGFHALLVPFVYLSHWLTGDYLSGGRWAMMAIFGTSMMLFDLLLVTGRVRWRWLWLVLFVLMPFQFFTRHAFVRAPGPSLAFMLLIVLLMFRGRHILTGLAVACYTHLYLGGVLYAPVLVGLYVLSSLVGPRGDRSVPWRLLLWSAGGWLVGVLTHPYSTGMVEFLKLQVFGSGLSPDISVGREWKPYENLWWFAQMSGVVLVAWAAAVCLRFRLGKALNAQELMLLLCHFLFLGLTFKARRFVEYWPVFCLLSAAFLAAPLITTLAEGCDYLVGRRSASRPPWMRRGFAMLAAVATLAIVYLSPHWRGIHRSASCDYDLAAVRDVMTFLEKNSEPGDVVFTDDWDIFPIYFYYNSHNHYIVGLDPKFTQARRPVLWERYVKISRGQAPADVTVQIPDASGEKTAEKVHIVLEDIRDHFGARFVITDRDHKQLAAKLAGKKEFAELIYPSMSYTESRDAPYLIFRVNPSEKHKQEDADASGAERADQ